MGFEIFLRRLCLLSVTQYLEWFKRSNVSENNKSLQGQGMLTISIISIQ